MMKVHQLSTSDGKQSERECCGEKTVWDAEMMKVHQLSTSDGKQSERERWGEMAGRDAEMMKGYQIWKSDRRPETIINHLSPFPSRLRVMTNELKT